MKRLLLILCIIGATLGINSAVASAANCTGTAGGISRYVDSGYQVMGYNAQISSCTGVEAVQWVYSGSGFSDCTESFPTCTFHQAYLNGTQSDITLNSPGSGPHSVLVAQTCWYGGVHSLVQVFKWRIKNSATHTWGSVATTLASGHANITC